MCNLYTLDSAFSELVEDFDKFLSRRLHLSAGPDTLADPPWKTAVWPKYRGLVVRLVDRAAPDRDLEPAVGRWGVVPWMHKGPAKDWKAQTNNCRSEEMTTKTSFRDALKGKRCIVPATAFYEHTGPKGSMTKHAITPAAGGLHYLAGLSSRHSWEGETTESYTMLMQAAADGDDMRPFHDRQPAFLDEETASIWLDPQQDYAPLLKSPLRGHLAFDPAQPAAA